MKYMKAFNQKIIEHQIWRKDNNILFNNYFILKNLNKKLFNNLCRKLDLILIYENNMVDNLKAKN